MKMVFVVYTELHGFTSPLMELLGRLGIDFYTRWEHAKGKGHGTDAHLGTPSFPAENVVMMMAFRDDALLDQLIEGVARLNEGISRPDYHIRLFQMPLERMV